MIVAACIKMDELRFIGGDFKEIKERILNDMFDGVSNHRYSRFMIDAKFGFINDKGEWFTVKEAYIEAKKQGQLLADSYDKMLTPSLISFNHRDLMLTKKFEVIESQKKLKEERENYIIAACIEKKGLRLTGRNHNEIRDRAFSEVFGDDFTPEYEEFIKNKGFMDRNGKFHNRVDAYSIADRAGQVSKTERATILQSYMITFTKEQLELARTFEVREKKQDIGGIRR